MSADWNRWHEDCGRKGDAKNGNMAAGSANPFNNARWEIGTCDQCGRVETQRVSFWSDWARGTVTGCVSCVNWSLRPWGLGDRRRANPVTRYRKGMLAKAIAHPTFTFTPAEPMIETARDVAAADAREEGMDRAEMVEWTHRWQSPGRIAKNLWAELIEAAR